jgi:hypothetical protein
LRGEGEGELGEHDFAVVRVLRGQVAEDDRIEQADDVRHEHLDDRGGLEPGGERAALEAALAEQYREPFVDAVRRGIESGAFAPRFDATAIVEVVVANIVGLLYPVVLGHLTPADTEYREIVLAQLAFALTARP